MNPSLFPSNSFVTIFILTFILIPTVISSAQTISYSDHCNSFAPEAIPTTHIFTRYPFLEPVTSHYTGGQNILGPDSPSQRSILFTPTSNLFRTQTFDTYKIQAQLRFISSNIYVFHSNYSRFYRPLVFYLDGFWSVSTNKLCMVGSAHWFSEKGKPLKLDAVLKLNFARFINLNNSLVSGILESLASVQDSDYFEPISMMGFPRVAQFKYNYSLVSNEECNGQNGNFTLQHSVASMQSLDMCSIFRDQFKTFKLENQDTGHPLSFPFSPSFLSLYAIQCSPHERKLRFLVEFQDRRNSRYDQSFNPNITLIGDGTWNGTNNELCILACHILNQTDPLGSAHVGDCSIRLTLYFPEVRSIMNTHTTEGQIWSTKKADDVGYFEPIKFQSFDHSFDHYGSKYEFTKLEKLRRICPGRKFPNWGSISYPSGYNWDMTFDMSVKHGNMVSTGSAVPIFVGNQFYNSHTVVTSNSNPFQAASLPAATSDTGPMNISYEITFRPFVNSTSELQSGIPLLPSTNNGKVEISAEGFYDSQTGRLCMIGCRNLNSSSKESRNESFDCEIMVRFRFPRIERNNGSFLIKGSIQSLRERSDALYFDPLRIVSLTYTETEAKESIWRMDLEIIMDLISVTLSCLFIVLQLFHVKKNPDMIPLISVLMMVILTLGYMVPLVLNFEAMFSNTRYPQNIPLGGSGGLLEVNEVIVRIVTMVAFILQFRLLQLTWNSKPGNDEQKHWNHEIRSIVICLPIYISGGLIMLLAKWIDNDYIISSNRSIWGDLRSYAGLTLDGFLFPQIVLNIFQISKGNALSYLFYIGNTFVRLLPHAYDLYRGQKNISHQFDRFYLYANPRADFYSTSWDVFIACGGVVFAVIVFLQQRFGGRFMLPKRFQESVEYEMVPVVNNE
ncbi:uncharacterized protein LOC111916983 [Lactuca sativa]|uniref:RING-type E3 ubiquitin transferase n=1 Tax=Lactuca sativa TaxID=4236 RepID=A0A9R1UCC4_LACSA|nr:uncharacterized protein LOC111916983 [Lactuca sativa]KAJ0184548.1 hypothetical protein LSAT_V11C900495180 [Lactuca sativa]